MSSEVEKSIEAMAKAVETILDDAKGEDICVLDLRKHGAFTDYFIIATGRSNTHVAHLADEVDRYAHQNQIEVLGIEGLPEAEWVLVDIGDIVVHLFQAENRGYYNLEKLWSTEGASEKDLDALKALRKPAS
ncbi:MAG: ribosome silencing factor [Magnetococcales bacterium]|nr:ribosome silencing factor [Magnetococcales bacterium]